MEYLNNGWRTRISQRIFIGIDGGGTKTLGRLFSFSDDDNHINFQDIADKSSILAEASAGPCALSNNFELACQNISQLLKALIEKSTMRLSEAFIVAGVSGAENKQLHAAMLAFLVREFDLLPSNILLTSDAHTSGVGAGGGDPIICIALGTGSVASIIDNKLGYRLIGGWGFSIGDEGGSAALGKLAVRQVLWEVDKLVFSTETESLLCKNIKSVIGHDKQQMLAWLSQANAFDYGQIAPVVTQAMGTCEMARDVFLQHEQAVLQLVNACYQIEPLNVVLTGGLAEATIPFIKDKIAADIKPAQGNSLDGACYLAVHQYGAAEQIAPKDEFSLVKGISPSFDERKLLGQLDNMLSESRNPNSLNIDVQSTEEILEIINQEDHQVPATVKTALPAIAKAVDAIVHSFKQGGRLIYLGAGTSGRLGILDAVECPPTFSVDNNMVKALIAGGNDAVYKAVEGAEDNPELARDDLKNLRLSPEDVVAGIAASGRTPYVIGGLQYARQLGSKTVAVTCNPDSPLSHEAEIGICAPVGPEVIAGSTRLKSGSAQKLILNMLTTASMIQMGKCYQNLMVDVNATNEKLVARASRIVMQATQCNHSEAKKVLTEANYSAKLAILMIKANVSATIGESALQKFNGNLRHALESL